MPTSQARTADDIADNIKSLVDRMVDAKFTQEIARRGQEVAEALAERSADVGVIASEAWKDTKPMRRDAAKRMARASTDAAKWSDRTWRKQLRPTLRDLWKQRTVAAGAAGAAVPVGRELVDSAAARLGIKRREERHWGAFFLGLLLGAAAGAIVALLTTPKRGDEMRQELGSRADEIATKARDEWVPLFQGGATNGHGGAANGGTLAETSAAATDLPAGSATALQEGATEASASGEAADRAAGEAADAISETYEPVDRDSTT
jgi:gas vesicle protein